MGILNITPDSFSDGGRYFSGTAALARARQLAAAGADILDIGAESTRPGSLPVGAAEEKARLLPVLKALRQELDLPLSVDTYKAEVATAALAAGADIINDISALTFDAAMAGVAARSGAGLILMHMQGTPHDMQADPHYEDVMAEIAAFLAQQVAAAAAAGVAPDQIVIDPGIGFGKRLEDNLTILRELGRLEELGLPLLVGPSRKSFIGRILDAPATERLEGTAAAVTAAILQGAQIVRVHDVAEMVRVARVADAIRDGAPGA